jgi:hypothetical protein
MCKKNNKTAGGSIDVEVDPYDPMWLYFQKTCLYPKLKMSTPVSSGQPTVVDNGFVNPGWSKVADVREQTTEFGLWLPEGDPVGQQVYYVDNIDYDAGIMKPALNPDIGIARPLSKGPAATISVTYQCVDFLPGPTPSIMNMSVSIGWEKNLFIVWTKVCGPIPPEDTGWSGVGIFFFVVFLLTTAACVVGCFYNYTKYNLTGFDVIPGIELFRACYRRLAGPPAYTPQPNYDDVPAESGAANTNTAAKASESSGLVHEHDGGISYQSDSGSAS